MSAGAQRRSVDAEMAGGPLPVVVQAPADAQPAHSMLHPLSTPYANVGPSAFLLGAFCTASFCGMLMMCYCRLHQPRESEVPPSRQGVGTDHAEDGSDAGCESAIQCETPPPWEVWDAEEAGDIVTVEQSFGAFARLSDCTRTRFLPGFLLTRDFLSQPFVLAAFCRCIRVLRVCQAGVDQVAFRHHHYRQLARFRRQDGRACRRASRRTRVKGGRAWHRRDVSANR